MAAYESIVNVEEFIADHYFTTDETKGNSYGKRVAAVVKQWRDDAKAAEADGFSLSHPFAEVTANPQQHSEVVGQRGFEGVERDAA